MARIMNETGALSLSLSVKEMRFCGRGCPSLYTTAATLSDLADVDTKCYTVRVPNENRDPIERNENPDFPDSFPIGDLP
jgi:hypothetical protein